MVGIVEPICCSLGSNTVPCIAGLCCSVLIMQFHDAAADRHIALQNVQLLILSCSKAAKAPRVDVASVQKSLQSFPCVTAAVSDGSDIVPCIRHMSTSSSLSKACLVFGVCSASSDCIEHGGAITAVAARPSPPPSSPATSPSLHPSSPAFHIHPHRPLLLLHNPLKMQAWHRPQHCGTVKQQ